MRGGLPRQSAKGEEHIEYEGDREGRIERQKHRLSSPLKLG